MYAPPLAVSETEASRLTTAAQADLADSAAALMGSLTSAGLVPVIYHRNGSSGVPAGSTTPIESLDVGDVLDAFDLFAVSSDREGFANAMLEAMAFGLPVVSTDVSGAREALDGEPRPGIVTGFSEAELAEAFAIIDKGLFEVDKAIA